MAGKFKPWLRREPLRKLVRCECGGEARLFSRRNYQFGRGSGGISTTGWKCNKCGKISLLGIGKGGK